MFFGEKKHESSIGLFFRGEVGKQSEGGGFEWRGGLLYGEGGGG